MRNKLQQYFPAIRTKKEIMDEIEGKEKLKEMFDGWKKEQQEEFLNFCTGVKGVKVLYDFMCKEILNPESTPERLDEFLSLLLNQNVKILEVLPNDSTRIADESSLVIKDIVVELEDRGIVNLEIQKIGYKFCGERSACYSADMLLRQYKRVRSLRKKKFSYKDIRPVYTIVLFETSPTEFHKFPNVYIHSFRQKSKTGVEMNFLQEYVYVCLDIFKIIHQNKDGKIKIESRLDAWLAFLCMDDPEAVIAISEKYPDFKAIYGQVYDMCRNIDEVMGMFSKELQELDRNTVQLMIDEMQEEYERMLEEACEQVRREKEQELRRVYQEKEELLAELERTKKAMNK